MLFKKKIGKLIDKCMGLSEKEYEVTFMWVVFLTDIYVVLAVL